MPEPEPPDAIGEADLEDAVFADAFVPDFVAPDLELAEAVDFFELDLVDEAADLAAVDFFDEPAALEAPDLDVEPAESDFAGLDAEDLDDLDEDVREEPALDALEPERLCAFAGRFDADEAEPLVLPDETPAVFTTAVAVPTAAPLAAPSAAP